MRRTILSFVACLALLYFFIFSHERQDLGGGADLLNLECTFYFLYIFFSETFLILIRIQRYIIVNVYSSLFKAPVTFLIF